MKNYDLIQLYVDQYDLSSKSRYRHQLYMRYYLYAVLRGKNFSLNRIGKIFNRSHCTVMHGLRWHDEWYKSNDKIYLKYTAELRDKFNDCMILKPLKIMVLECENINDLYSLQTMIKNNYI